MALVQHKLSLEITPGTPEPVLTVSEYDVNREINILLMQDGAPFKVPSGTTAKVEGTIRKNGFSVNANISGSTITFTLTESMTAITGRVWVKIKLIKDDRPISTCAFIMIVDRAGIETDTVIGADGFNTLVPSSFTRKGTPRPQSLTAIKFSFSLTAISILLPYPASASSVALFIISLKA